MALIRQANVLDASEIARVHVASWQEAYRGQIPDTVLSHLSADESEKAWKKLLKNNVVVFVLEVGGKIKGFASICASRDEDADSRIVAEISAIYIEANYWGKGFGKMLMNAALTAIKKQRFEEVTLWVLKGNDRARKFYERVGFIETKIEKIENKLGFEMEEVRYKLSVV